MLATTQPQDYLDTALDALRTGNNWQIVLDELPVPVFLTDAAGAVTYWNPACVDFAGRMPKLGEDRWCVSWRLYTTSGEPLPHEQSPGARAIREKREIRDEVMVAMRPDGERIACRPYPTPWFDGDGNLEGVVNLLIDVTDEQAGALTEQAARCRRLARATHDAQASQVLASMADGYHATAAALRAIK